MFATSMKGNNGRKFGYCLTILGMLMLSGTTGCCAHGKRHRSFPYGIWEGSGSYVFETWSGAQDAGEGEVTTQEAKDPQSLHGHYPTQLKVCKTMLNGEPIIRLEILSCRSEKIPDLGEQSHLIVGLKRVKKIGRCATMYQVVDWAFNPDKSDDELRPDSNAPPIGATCMELAGAHVLQLHYEHNFTDTFAFKGDRAFKVGSYYDAKEGLIHWTESLKRIPRTRCCCPCRGS